MARKARRSIALYAARMFRIRSFAAIAALSFAANAERRSRK